MIQSIFEKLLPVFVSPELLGAANDRLKELIAEKTSPKPVTVEPVTGPKPAIGEPGPPVPASAEDIAMSEEPTSDVNSTD